MILEVKEGGLLGLTQQMSSMGSEDFSHVSPNAAVSNPFASSTGMLMNIHKCLYVVLFCTYMLLEYSQFPLFGRDFFDEP